MRRLFKITPEGLKQRALLVVNQNQTCRQEIAGGYCYIQT
jgi:hypothetical protein